MALFLCSFRISPRKSCVVSSSGNLSMKTGTWQCTRHSLPWACSIRSKAVSAFRPNPKGVKGTGADGLPLVPGDIGPADLAKITRLCQAAQDAGIVKTGMAAAVTITVGKTPTNLGGGSYGISVASQIEGLLYIDKIDATSQFITSAGG